MTDEVVVDTDVVSRVVLPATVATGYERFVPLLQGKPLVLAAQTVGELRLWAIDAQWGDLRRSELEAFIERCAVMPVDDRVDIPNRVTTAWARLTAACKKSGHGLAAKDHTGDRWIAATAIHLGIPLVSNDGIFIDAPLVDLLRPE
jgi:predicted nucleic acid-binding protein